MPDEEKQNRMERVARVLENVVVDGDEFQVVVTDEGILVNETRAFQFQEKYPRLYGRLLAVNEQMEEGCAVTMIAMALAGGLFFAIHVGWLTEYLSPQVTEKLDSWWFLGILVVVAFMLAAWIDDLIETRVYRQHREELFDVVRSEGFERDILLVEIKDDPELERVVKQLKRDPRPPKGPATA